MLGAVGNNHGRHRKILAHAFSTSALKGQEGLLTQYADMLVDCLREETNKLDSTVDISQYLMWTTFDIIADLCFGEPYGCLADPTADHPYAEMVMSAIAGGRFHYIQVHWPWVKTVGLFYDKVAVEKRQEYHRWVKKQTYKRMAAETKRPDFTALILAHRDNHGEDQSISDAEMCSNNSLMLAAGTETTATAMTVAFFLLLNNPDKMAKAVEEVRSRFESTQDITVDAANQLSYLIACMNETLRCVPPVPLGFPRRVPESGGEISGHFIPGNCKVSFFDFSPPFPLVLLFSLWGKLTKETQGRGLGVSICRISLRAQLQKRRLFQTRALARRRRVCRRQQSGVSTIQFRTTKVSSAANL